MNCCVLVGGQGDPRHRPSARRSRIGRLVPVDEHLIQVLAVEREHLDALIVAVGDVHEAVIGHLDPVHRPELLRARALGLAGRRRLLPARRRIQRHVAEGAPQSLEGAGVRIEHQHSAVAVPVCHKRLVGLRIHEHFTGHLHVFRVLVPAALIPPAELRHEPALGGQLEQHVVRSGRARRKDRVASADPDVILVVHGNAVLEIRPLVRVRWTAPRLHELPVLVELEDRRGGAFLLLCGYEPIAVHDPHVIPAIDGDVDRGAQNPLVGKLRPRGIHFERRRSGRATRALRGRRHVEHSRPTDGCHEHQHDTSHSRSRHRFSPHRIATPGALPPVVTCRLRAQSTAAPAELVPGEVSRPA